MLVLQVHGPTICLDYLGHNMSNMKIKRKREREREQGEKRWYTFWLKYVNWVVLFKVLLRKLL